MNLNNYLTVELKAITQQFKVGRYRIDEFFLYSEYDEE
jgi:hypothetical protein